ncbi:carbohydrate ABC transporter permease [Phytohabitans aurantiacus]|jgi:raffinose/stachyose/melibiose transport system permease protein|uniref:Sugar ABC transporter permease n=1 Tax=Phytohabitans aurantiacus TaxID=3016789 RepID=A0ABQ5QQA2_9ACTN|nr:sugar ABC transporter permease [Phytohabitans aurantiacus]GLH96422.1 sugar ABC transporter permease [Phytohabitans aurantiacus]
MAQAPVTTRGRGGRAGTWYLFLVPALLLYSLFVVYPLLTGLSYSVFSWKGTVRDAFVGVDNYVGLFTNEAFRSKLLPALGHNLALFAGTMLVQNTMGLAFALAFSRARRGKRALQIIFATPYLVNPLVIGYLWTLLLSPTFGPANTLLRAIGPDELAKPWLGDPSTALPMVILITTWQWVGFPMLLFSAAIGGIPAEYAEAARVDGASSWRVFWHITLPLLRPAIGTITVLSFIGSMNTFALVYALGGSSGGPAGSTDVLGLLFYRAAFASGDINAVGTASALAVFLFTFIFGTTILLNRILRQGEEAM